MKRIYLFTVLSSLFFMSCSSDDDSSNNEPEENLTYQIVNNGTAGVNSINDDDDSNAIEVKQAIPDVQAVTEEYLNSLPIVLFFDDKVLVPSIEGNFEVTENGDTKGGIVTINENSNGNAILTFTPYSSFDANSVIELKLSQGFSDDGGNSFAQGDYTLSFGTIAESNGDFEGNDGFENGDQGVVFLGDGNVLTGPEGCISATEGSNYLALTTGDALVSSDSAIGGDSSIAVLGPINNSFSSFSFDYNFLSSEFQEFVDSQFDDTVLVTVVGPDGSNSQVVTSINIVGEAGNTQCDGFAGLPDDGDDYAGETGWITETISASNVGTPAFIFFTVTDVSDTIYSSALTIDNITF